MTPAGRAAFALYGLVLVGASGQGAAHLGAGAFRQAAGFYVVAVACLVGMLREASRAALDEPGRDGRADPGPWRRWRADRQARALLRAEECSCDTAWWPSPNRPHAPWCRARQNRSHPA
ncbi:hypothetical protein [Streptomyces canus]|uniref:hypothetical protein n=1 Tax=Streptomyces canus TaxID=58343 RepID=UPI002E2671B2